jgi:hypothetical protein
MAVRSPDGARGARHMVALRLLVQSAVLVGAVGIVGHYVGLVLVTSTVGPTAYLMLAHPDDVTARVCNAVLGHGIAIGCGLACLAAFGLWHHSPVTQLGHATSGQVAASALATALTLAGLTLLGRHHAPAAATALLISTGVAGPGRPLYGLVVGLVIVIILAPVLARLPLAARSQTAKLG